MGYIYLSSLLFSLFGIGFIDYKYKLALWNKPYVTIASILIVVSILLIWDVFGIKLGIFYPGDSNIVSGVMLAPKLPLEEPFFLVLLSYTSLILWKKLS